MVQEKETALSPEEQEQLAFAMRDLDEFLASHADVDLAQLLDNARCVRFCGSRLGKEPITALYEDFVSLLDDAGAAAAARIQSRSARSTGGGTAASGTLSPAQKAVLDAWNEEHPEMAMTAREFLGR